MPDDHIKRCDVRVPIDLYNEIEKIAVEKYNAPLYHKTGKPQVSSTIIELLRLGIENLRGEVSDNIPDALSDKIRELESQIEQIRATSLSDNKSDTVPDINTDDRIKAAIGEAIPKAIAELKSDEEFLGAIALRAHDSIASEVQKIYTIAAENNLHPSENVLGQAEAESDEETTTQVDKASLAPIFEEVEESEAGKLLSKKSALAIAKQRGYKSGDTAFAQWFRDNKGNTLHGIKKHSDRGKYIDVEG